MPPSPEQGTEPEDDDHSSNAPMTYTFLADMTPAAYPSITGESAPPVQLSATHDVSLQSSNFAATPPTSPLTPIEGTSTSALQLPPRGSHGKKRDPSYIPRPPNAFILFRSSFINSQQVPRKVEGNHRELSKIIGMCWRTLPLEERHKWEEKAVVAQAEHRRRYPDWRFRPGANAMLLKLQDGPRSKPRKRAATRSKAAASAADGAQKVDVSKDKGKRRAKPRTKAAERERGEKIAQTSVEGRTGLELETGGVKEWEGSSSSAGSQEGQSMGSSQEDPATAQGRRTSNADSAQPMSTIVEEETGEDSSVMQDDTEFDSRPPTPCSTPTMSSRSSHSHSHPYPHRSRSPERGNRAETMPVGHLSEVPLTQLYKRSLSVPAPTSRSRFPETSPHSHTSSTINYQTFPSPTHSWGHLRRDTVSFPMNPADYHPHHSVQPSHPQSSWADAGVNRSPPQLENSWWDPSSYGRSDLNPPIPMSHGDIASGQYNQEFSEVHRSTWPPPSMESPTAVEDPLLLQGLIPSPSLSSTNTDPPNNLTIVSPHDSTPSDIPFFNENSTLPRSSFSALSGWDGDFNPPSSSSIASSSAIPDSTHAAACDDMSCGWQPPPGWENQIQPIGLQGGAQNWNQPQPHPSTNDPTGRSLTPRSTRNANPFDSGFYPGLHYNYNPFGFQHKLSNLQGSVYDVSDYAENSGSA